MAKRTAQEITIQTHYLRLAAKLWPLEGGHPVLGLHGWLDNAASFDRLAPLLPQANLVSLDLPGHGRSDHRPPGMRYHYTDYVDDVMAAADALNWDQFTLLGHSMGAGIGCFAASAYPDRITKLILIEGMGAVTGELQDVPVLLRRSIEAMKPQTAKEMDTNHDIMKMIHARSAAGNLSLESAEILVRRSVKCKGDGFNWQSDKRLKRSFPQYFTNEVILAFLRGILSPVLLIVAEDGSLRKRPYFESRCRAIRKLRMVTLPGHHHLHLDNPGPVAEVINRYL